ncbi:hypothetical protein QCA50_003190 [Cerrena zonata]|uniref:Uncharacterized protein n=1 Tax=Cerrena zonata TaxID=2478898 RepID=A0AAW0GJQ0_9APHY
MNYPRRKKPTELGMTQCRRLDDDVRHSASTNKEGMFRFGLTLSRSAPVRVLVQIKGPPLLQHTPSSSLSSTTTISAPLPPLPATYTLSTLTSLAPSPSTDT